MERILKLFQLVKSPDASLEKGGAMRAFKYKPDPMAPVMPKLRDWQNRGEGRETLPKLEGPERQRALHKLSAQTKVKSIPGEGRYYLLHRGMGTDEMENTVGGTTVNHDDKRSSWTPTYSVAKSFAREYAINDAFVAPRTEAGPGHITSAWVHESHIHMIPKQLGRYVDGGNVEGKPGPNKWREEHEVVVAPNHKSKLATPDEQAGSKQYLRTVNDLVNERGSSGLKVAPANIKSVLGYIRRAKSNA